MASDRAYLEYVMEQLSGTDGVSHRPMMGEYILYRNGKVFGGVYDNRLLVKPVQSARALMPGAPLELPYEGGSEMLLVEDIDDREFLCRLVEAMEGELPAVKKRRKKGKSDEKA